MREVLRLFNTNKPKLALLLRHQQKPNFSYLSTAAAAAYHLSKRNRRNRRRSSTPPSFLDSGYFVCGSLLLMWSLGFAALVYSDPLEKNGKHKEDEVATTISTTDVETSPLARKPLPSLLTLEPMDCENQF